MAITRAFMVFEFRHRIDQVSFRHGGSVEVEVTLECVPGTTANPGAVNEDLEEKIGEAIVPYVRLIDDRWQLEMPRSSQRLVMIILEAALSITDVIEVKEHSVKYLYPT